jgi:hypothetical protein
MKLLLIPFIALFLFTACKKPVVESVKTNNSADSLTYQPKVPGSTWTYTRTVAGFGNTTYNFTRLNYDSSAYGNPFNVFSSGIDVNQYIRQDGDKYYSVFTPSTNKPVLIVLDVTKNVNESWVGGTNGSDTYTYTMKEKFPTYVLDNFTFRNVLKVYTERTTTTSGGGSSITLKGDTYYAQGIGQIKTEGSVFINGIEVAVSVKLITIDLK